MADPSGEEASPHPRMRPVPVLHFSYAHRILAEVGARGAIDLQVLFADVGTESLFKSEKEHKAPLQRARQLVRFARDLGLMSGEGDLLELTDTGREYVAAGTAEDVFDTSPRQSELLRQYVADGAAAGGVAWGAALTLNLIASTSGPFSSEDLGRALGQLGGMSQWREIPTFATQGDRFLALLKDAGLVGSNGGVSDEGGQLLAGVAIPEHSPLEALVEQSQHADEPLDDISTAARVWIVRAGQAGHYEDLARAEGVCVIGWSDLGQIAPDMSREEIKGQIGAVYGEQREASLASQAGQVYRFVHDLELGDLIVLPLMSDRGHVAIGKLTGGYEHRTDEPFADTDARNTRGVEWLVKDLPYERFDPDLRDAFGQQGTLSEISKPDAAQRIIEVLNGADASAIHLVLKWSPAIHPDTIDRHREVAESQGAVWWGRQSKRGTTGLGRDWLSKLQAQLGNESETFVFLHSGAATWRTRLLAVTTDESEIEADLVPDYYAPDAYHSLWVKLASFEEISPSEITDGFVLAQSSDPVTKGGLGNQTPLIIRKQSGSLPGRFFILSQSQSDETYDDQEGERYHWTSRSSGATKKLANSPGAEFVYYRPGEADDGTSRSYFGTGVLASVSSDERDGIQHYTATIEGFEQFASPVPFASGPPRTAQTSIQQITRAEFERLLRAGGLAQPVGEFTIEAIIAEATKKDLILAPEIYAQLHAALESGKHVILTGPPGTAKTTLAHAVAKAAQAAGRSEGYLLTTATADWTTYDTIGGLKPASTQSLEFEEGHFLKAIRSNHWLVIDELNRSHFDRAFGQLFTVLSGQPVVLPYNRPVNPDKPLVLVPEGEESPAPDGDILEIPQSWRVIATMNVFDKSLLFEMSFALMRRFAFVEVASPSSAVFEGLIDLQTSGEAAPADLAKKLLRLREVKDLGPAVFIDLAKFLRQRMAAGAEDDGQLLFEAFYSYLLPQFEGIDVPTGDRLFAELKPLMGSAQRRNRLRDTLNAVLGLELQAPSQKAADTDEADEEEDAE